jgi:hypothetical protein
MLRRLVLAVVAICAVTAAVLTFWGGSRRAQAAGANIVVLCPSCTYEGLPREGHIILMDSSTGEIWAYSDAAVVGKRKPVHLGRLVLGQPVAPPTK